MCSNSGKESWAMNRGYIIFSCDIINALSSLTCLQIILGNESSLEKETRERKTFFSAFKSESLGFAHLKLESCCSLHSKSHSWEALPRSGFHSVLISLRKFLNSSSTVEHFMRKCLPKFYVNGFLVTRGASRGAICESNERQQWLSFEKQKKKEKLFAYSIRCCKCTIKI